MVVFLPLLIVILLGFSAGRLLGEEGQQPGPVLARFEAVVDLGKDQGQRFGSIFEARTGNGRVVAGAGFMEVYNTRFRVGRHMLQFFVRPLKNEDQFTLQRLPHPDLDCGVYMFDLDEKLYAWSSVQNNSLRRWDEPSKRWLNQLPHQTVRLRSGETVMRLGKGLLTMANNKVSYNDRMILGPPTRGNYYNFYYAGGWLCFYHRLTANSDAFTKIYACPWTPEKDGPVELSRAVVMDTKYVGETPFAWGQFQETVLTVSNQGGVYAFDGMTWKTLLEADNTVSYQVYSMLNYYDRLLLAQYPTGYLFEFMGQELKLLKGWPPRLPGVSPRAREAQTLSIYRGDLLVGVWPWAELWRYNHQAKKWHSMGRMFTHPEVTDKRVHPYEAAANKYGLVTNHWGQRVTGMVPFGDSLMLSTSSKGTSRWYDKYDFLTEGQRREYGAVLQLKMPGNLAAQIEWKDRPSRFEFILTRDKMIIRQDGQQLASTPLQLTDQGEKNALEHIHTTWGQGVFGQFNGKSLKHSH